jgi:hypothetical protein
MLQSIPIAQHEYCEALGTGYWRSAVHASFRFDDPPKTPPPQPAATPAGCHSERREDLSASERFVRGESASSSNSSLDTHHSFTPSEAEGPLPQPAPAPHAPLPRTGAEFFQQVMAGLNSSRSEISTPSAPGRETGSADAPSSSATSPTSCSTNQTQPASTPQPTSPQQS